MEYKTKIFYNEDDERLTDGFEEEKTYEDGLFDANFDRVFGPDPVTINEIQEGVLQFDNAFAIKLPDGVILNPETDEDPPYLSGFCGYNQNKSNIMNAIIERVSIYGVGSIEYTLKDICNESDEHEKRGYFMIHSSDDVEIGCFLQYVTDLVKHFINARIFIRVGTYTLKFVFQYKVESIFFNADTDLTETLKALCSIFTEVKIINKDQIIVPDSDTKAIVLFVKRLMRSKNRTNSEKKSQRKKLNTEDDVDNSSADDVGSEFKERKRVISKKQKKYEDNCTIVTEIPDFSGKTFVASGVDDTEIVKSFLTKNGAFLRTQVSGKTDYLIVSPYSAGESKYKAVLEQAKKGHTVKIIFWENFKSYMSDWDDDDEEFIDDTDDVDIYEDDGIHCSEDTPVIVCDDWVITVPANYVYSTDKKIIGHRYLVFGLDDGTLDLGMPFSSTVNFSVTNPLEMNPKQNEPYPALPLDHPLMEKYLNMAQFIGNECLRKNSDIAIYYSVGEIEDCDEYDNGTFSKSKGVIVTRKSIYSFQMFDHLSDTQYEVETKLMSLLDSIRTVDEYESGKTILHDIEEDISEIKESIQTGISDMQAWSEREKKRLKEEEQKREELERKKAAARENHNISDDIALMYMTLIIDEANGYDQQTDEDFYQCYEDDFPALSESELSALRSKIKADIRTSPNIYDKDVRLLPYDKRFHYSAENMFNSLNYTDRLCDIETFITSTVSRWFDNTEISKVRNEIKQMIIDYKEELDEQLDSTDENWKNFYTAKTSLYISLFDYSEEIFDPNNKLMVKSGDVIGAVQLATSGVFRLSATLYNYFAVYWNVDFSDIWDAARANGIYDQRKSKDDGLKERLAQSVYDRASQGFGKTNLNYNQINFNDDKKAEQFTQPLFNTTMQRFNETDQSNVGFDYSKRVSEILDISSSNSDSQESKQTEIDSTKKEGCYIATAVYGSYDAPEVIVLRKFRDNTLKKSFLGRMFIRIYYTLSPPFARKLKNAHSINRFIKNILDKWVDKLQSD